MKTGFLLSVLLTCCTLFLNAQAVGVNTDGSNPAPSAILDVKSNDKGFLPPRLTQAERDAIVNPAEGLMIYNTTRKEPEYYNGLGWVGLDGLKIGDSYVGGIVFYLYTNTTGLHGLVAAPSDQSAGAAWGCSGTDIPGAAVAQIGAGQASTTAIVNNCATAGIAARLCDDLVLNGYSDWFLPNYLELDQMRVLYYTGIGGLSNDLYWSSNQYTPSSAYIIFLGGNYVPPPDKSDLHRVRAVRSF